MLELKKYIMSGRGVKVTWSITCNGQELFKTDSGSFHAWTKKKDTQRILDAIKEYGIDHVLYHSDIDRTKLVNLHLLEG